MLGECSPRINLFQWINYAVQVISRYEKGFGPRNYRFNIQTVEFIVVDAQTLDGKVTTPSY